VESDKAGTAHGMRSAFKDFSTEEGHVDDYVSELALSHIETSLARGVYATKRDLLSFILPVLLCTFLVTQEGSAMTESTATFTFRVDEGLKAEFAIAAKSRDRTGAQLLRDFMRDFVRQQEEAAGHDVWFRRQVQNGLDSANGGNLIPAAEVEAKFAARRTATRLKLDASE